MCVYVYQAYNEIIDYELAIIKWSFIRIAWIVNTLEHWPFSSSIVAAKHNNFPIMDTCSRSFPLNNRSGGALRLLNFKHNPQQDLIMIPQP